MESLSELLCIFFLSSWLMPDVRRSDSFNATVARVLNLAICAFFAALNGALFTVGGNHGYGTWGFREDRDGVGWVATIEVIMLIVSFSACMGFVPVEACSFYHRPSWTPPVHLFALR